MMTVKGHYENHLAAFYGWMVGDVDKLADHFKEFCLKQGIVPKNETVALDLGAGNGIQSIALDRLGFRVWAIDFNAYLLDELKAKNASVNTVIDDIRNVQAYSSLNPELVVCCGDTLTHLDSFDEARKMVHDVFEILSEGGAFIVSFRDYSVELTDTNRFIPVKSDSQRVFTCVLEYFTDKLRVTDLLYEKEDDGWKQKVSSYYKIRLTGDCVIDYLRDAGFVIDYSQKERGVVTIIGRKE